jgi:hypothetical protein
VGDGAIGKAVLGAGAPLLAAVLWSLVANTIILGG